MTLPELATLPLAERLRAMEMLWDSLSQDPDFDPGPAWHAELLPARRAELEQGQHSSWDEAKIRIRTVVEQHR